MSLIKCPECDKQISDAAYACIHCGYPLRKDMVIARIQVLKIRQLSDEKWKELTEKNEKKAMP